MARSGGYGQGMDEQVVQASSLCARPASQLSIHAFRDRAHRVLDLLATHAGSAGISCLHVEHDSREVSAPISSRRLLDTNFVIHEIRVMKNITIALRERTAAWVRVWAARQGKSVSAALAALLEEKRTERRGPPSDWATFSGQGPTRLSSSSYPGREELHER